MAVKICHKCGESNTENAMLCASCGASLKEVAAEGTRNADKYEKSRSDGPRCRQCGETLDPKSRKCKYCGTPVYKKPEASRFDYSEEDSHHKAGVAAVILLIITTIVYAPAGLVIGGVAVFSDDPDKRFSGILLMILGLIVMTVKHFVHLG